jgi:RES domain-containing protein
MTSPSSDDPPRRPSRRLSRRGAAAATPYFTRVHPVRTTRDFDPATLPVRRVSGTFWHHGSPSRDPLELPERAPASGRYHAKGQQPRLYASSTRDAAWGELFRHVYGPLSPFEVKRRMAKLDVIDLPVLDLTDAAVRRQLGVTEQELVGNRYRACQLIASLARRRPDRFGGILAPSAAVPNATTLVIFSEWRHHARVEHSRIVHPPRRLMALFERLIGTLPLAVQDEALALLRELRRELRSRLAHPRPDERR